MGAARVQGGGERPLSGLKVVDFTAMVAGPWATRLLADCGADVVKIEAIGDGDALRGSPPVVDGVSRVFAHFNGGKKSVALNLKAPAGVAAARALAADADVVVENFRPGVMARLGLDYATLSSDHPRLVYCSISGYGQAGPSASKAAFAPAAHAASGFDYVMGTTPGGAGAPKASRIMVADFAAGIYAFGAIQTALLNRERSGRGSHIDVSLMESVLSMLAFQLQEAQSTQPVPDLTFTPIAAADGHIAVPLASVKAYHTLFQIIGRLDWMTHPDFSSTMGIVGRYEEVQSALATWAAERSARDCAAALDASGLPCSIYVKPADLFEDPQLVARGAFATGRDAEGEYRVLNAPFRFDTAAIATDVRTPRTGEDTAEVISRLLGAKSYRSLAASGVAG